MKKRILVTISFSFSVRYLVRTGMLAKLQDFAIPVIAITWKQDDLIAELEAEGFEVYLIEPPSLSDSYINIRRKIDIWFKYFRLKSISTKIQETYLRKYQKSKKSLLSNLSSYYNQLKFRLPGVSRKMLIKEHLLLKQEIGFHKMNQKMMDLDIDAVFTVTPFHRQEDLLLRVCKNLGKKMITAILSFDNITKRGWIPVEYDVYMVWNKFNAAELQRIYPEYSKAMVYITGAPQFDFYYQDDFVLPKNIWMAENGINEITEKIILYAGGPEVLLPNETQYVRAIAEALKDDPGLNKTILLFRCHPVDKIERWKNALADFDNVRFEATWTGAEKLTDANIAMDDVRRLCSTLAYTDVHINFCSTMTVDGSAFRKPQIGPYYDDIDKKNEKHLRDLYKQEHFIPIIETGGLALAQSKDELIHFIRKALKDPESFLKNTDSIVREIITYTDGNSTARVVDIIRNEVR